MLEMMFCLIFCMERKRALKSTNNIFKWTATSCTRVLLCILCKVYLSKVLFKKFTLANIGVTIHTLTFIQFVLKCYTNFVEIFQILDSSILFQSWRKKWSRNVKEKLLSHVIYKYIQWTYLQVAAVGSCQLESVKYELLKDRSFSSGAVLENGLTCAVGSLGLNYV